MSYVMLGSQGTDVKNIQQRLKALHLYSGKIGGVFGRVTKRAVLAFQQSRGLLADGIVGPQTLTALMLQSNNSELEVSLPTPGEKIPGHLMLSKCSAISWKRFMKFVDLTQNHPVVYGPGRGLFVQNAGEYDDGWVITWGAGKLGRKEWAIKNGKRRGPSFHCSSLTNFLLGYLLNYNEMWTHAGNMPHLETICLKDSNVHKVSGVNASFRGYGQHMLRLASDGDTKERIRIRFKRVERYLDAVEIWERRRELATFNFFSQGDKKNGRWNLDHHTGVFVYKHKEDRFYRLAADGYRGGAPKAYSGTPVSFTEIDDEWPKKEKHRVYQIFRLIPDTPSGDFGVQRPRKDIYLED